MSAYSLDARVDDKLAIAPSANKQLVNLIRQGIPDEECEIFLKLHHMVLQPKPQEKDVFLTVSQAVLQMANDLGVPEGSYEERREGLRQIGLKFFGGEGHAAPKTPKRHEIKEISMPPTQTPEALAAKIRRLEPIERQQLLVSCDETLGALEKARKFGLKLASFSVFMARIYAKLGVAIKANQITPEERSILLRKAISLLSEEEVLTH